MSEPQAKQEFTVLHGSVHVPNPEKGGAHELVVGVGGKVMLTLKDAARIEGDDERVQNLKPSDPKLAWGPTGPIVEKKAAAK